MAVATRANPEDDAVCRDVLQRLDLLGNPDDRVQREDKDSKSESNARRHRGGGSQGDAAVEKWDAAAGDELVDDPDGLQTKVLGVSCRSANIARQLVG